MKSQIQVELVQIVVSIIACINGIFNQNCKLIVFSAIHIFLKILQILFHQKNKNNSWIANIIFILAISSQIIYIEYILLYNNQVLIFLYGIQFQNDYFKYVNKNKYFWLYCLIIHLTLLVKIISLYKDDILIIVSSVIIIFALTVSQQINQSQNQIPKEQSPKIKISECEQKYHQHNQVYSPNQLSPYRQKYLNQEINSQTNNQPFQYIQENQELPSLTNQINLDIFMILPFGLIIIDQNKIVKYVSEQCLKILEVSKQNLLNTLRTIFTKYLYIPSLYFYRPNELNLNLRKKFLIKRMSSVSTQNPKLTQNLFDKLLTMSDELSDLNLELIDILLSFNEVSIQQTLKSIFPFYNLSQSNQDLLSVASNASQTVLYMEYTLTCSDNKQKKLQLTIAINQDVNQITTLTIVVEDVTKKKKYSELQNKLKFQEQLLLSFSHELKTPLNCSIQSLSLAMSQVQDQEIINLCIKPAYISNQLLMFQLSDILDFAAFQSLTFAYNLTEFQLCDLNDIIESLYSLQAQQKEIKLTFNCESQVAQTIIKSDKQRILQVLINLLNNAIRHTPVQGNIELFIKKSKKGIDLYRIGVIDDGTGILESKFQTIKQRLKDNVNRKSNQIISEYEQDKKIFGLGYKISNKIVSGLRGTQKAYLKLRNLRKGLKVYFYIKDYGAQTKQSHLSPVASNLEDSNKREIEKEQSFQDKIQQIKQMKIQKLKDKANYQLDCCASILIVDDEPFNHLPLRAILSTKFIKSDSVYNGEEAVKRVQQKMNQQCCSHKFYKLIFMDIQMPIKDGFQALQEVNNLQNDLNYQILKIFYLNQIEQKKQSKIIICSAFDNLQNIRKAEEKQATHFLPKPITKQSLQEVLDKYYYIN